MLDPCVPSLQFFLEPAKNRIEESPDAQVAKKAGPQEDYLDMWADWKPEYDGLGRFILPDDDYEELSYTMDDGNKRPRQSDRYSSIEQWRHSVAKCNIKAPMKALDAPRCP
jgi:hypothetical protein